MFVSLLNKYICGIFTWMKLFWQKTPTLWQFSQVTEKGKIIIGNFSHGANLPRPFPLLRICRNEDHVSKSRVRRSVDFFWCSLAGSAVRCRGEGEKKEEGDLAHSGSCILMDREMKSAGRQLVVWCLCGPCRLFLHSLLSFFLPNTTSGDTTLLPVIKSRTGYLMWSGNW